MRSSNRTHATILLHKLLLQMQVMTMLLLLLLLLLLLMTMMMLTSITILSEDAPSPIFSTMLQSGGSFDDARASTLPHLLTDPSFVSAFEAAGTGPSHAIICHTSILLAFVTRHHPPSPPQPCAHPSPTPPPPMCLAAVQKRTEMRL